ncbi:Hypothetical predicted protein [Cloeon dipterum]|uniref:Uncharacterized protein n=1 Tax=Cloeon dipterum TaxID=197152 RepID=A0A8S1BZD5_9INSE|nr:Hypothetical predicted protein [Cloeon dipterum]
MKQLISRRLILTPSSRSPYGLRLFACDSASGQFSWTQWHYWQEARGQRQHEKVKTKPCHFRIIPWIGSSGSRLLAFGSSS